MWLIVEHRETLLAVTADIRKGGKIRFCLSNCQLLNKGCRMWLDDRGRYIYVHIADTVHLDIKT